MTDADRAFANLVIYCAAQPEFVEQFNRLTGCNLGQSANRTALDIAIDQATGAPGEAETDMAIFVAFVHDFIWLRLPQVPTPQGADIANRRKCRVGVGEIPFEGRAGPSPRKASPDGNGVVSW